MHPYAGTRSDVLAGDNVEHAPPVRLRADNLELPRTTLDRPVFFDFDGDGEEELFLRVSDVVDGIEQSSAGLLVQDGLQIHAPDKSASLLRSARSRSVALASV